MWWSHYYGDYALMSVFNRTTDRTVQHGSQFIWIARTVIHDFVWGSAHALYDDEMNPSGTDCETGPGPPHSSETPPHPFSRCIPSLFLEPSHDHDLPTPFPFTVHNHSLLPHDTVHTAWSNDQLITGLVQH